jgi:hypothetical protein
MFDGVWPLSYFAYLAVFALCGAIVGWWVEKQIRKQIRRMRWKKLGFSADDLKSKERFFKRYGEVCVARMPQKISFQEVSSHSWSKPSKYEQSKEAFQSLGFQRTVTFVASPQKWVAEFWLSSQAGIFAKIIDSKDRGVYSEVTVMKDGIANSFENTEECGLNHREPDRWVHRGLITPAELVQIALHDKQSNDAKQMDLAECVSIYENSVNEYLDWRRSVGITPEEAKHVLERMGGRSLETLNWR